MDSSRQQSTHSHQCNNDGMTTTQLLMSSGCDGSSGSKISLYSRFRRRSGSPSSSNKSAIAKNSEKRRQYTAEELMLMLDNDRLQRLAAANEKGAENPDAYCAATYAALREQNAKYDRLIDKCDDGSLQFCWKEVLNQKSKMSYILGKIPLERIPAGDIGASLFNLCDYLATYVETKELQLSDMAEENERFKKEKEEAISRLQETADSKQSSETELLCKVLDIVNCKKEKIRELQRKLDNKDATAPQNDSATVDQPSTSDVGITSSAANVSKRTKPVKKAKNIKPKTDTAIEQPVMTVLKGRMEEEEDDLYVPPKRNRTVKTPAATKNSGSEVVPPSLRRNMRSSTLSNTSANSSSDGSLLDKLQ